MSRVLSVVKLTAGMRVLDVENALCWTHRYVNAYQDKRTRSLADIPAPSYDPEITEKCGPPAWCVEEKWLGSTSRMAWDADHREEEDRVESLGDGVYEIEKVVARLGSLDDNDGRFRVRWTGWTPEHDTWERASSLREDAEEVSVPIVAMDMEWRYGWGGGRIREGGKRKAESGEGAKEWSKNQRPRPEDKPTTPNRIEEY